MFIINDTVEEPTEQFRLHLGKVFSSNKGGGKLGGRNTTIIKIVDDDRKLTLDRSFLLLYILIVSVTTICCHERNYSQCHGFQGG